MHIGLLQITEKKNLHDSQWEYVGTPAKIIKQKKTNIFTPERYYLPDLTKSANNKPTVLMGIFDFYNMDIKKSFVYAYKGYYFTKHSSLQIPEIPPFVFSLKKSELNIPNLLSLNLVCLRGHKKKIYKTNEYGNEIIQEGQKVPIKENLILQKGISFLLQTSTGYILLDTSTLIWGHYFKNKGFANKEDDSVTINNFIQLGEKYNMHIINDDYYKSLKMYERKKDF